MSSKSSQSRMIRVNTTSGIGTMGRLRSVGKTRDVGAMRAKRSEWSETIVATLFGVGLAVAAPSMATELPDSTAEERTSVAVTVYNVDLALVRETRSLDLPAAGTGTVRFMDVPSAINPRTVHVEPRTEGSFTLLEQNFEYDLLSPEKLMEKYVGRDVEIIEQAEDLTTRRTAATLLSTSGGPVYRVGDEIVLGHPGRVVLPTLPEDLVARPTLVWTLAVAAPGRQEVEASYLTDAMSWSADYVAVVSPDDTRLDLTGWVTIDNRSGAAYRDATLKLVAGDVRRVTPRGYDDVRRMRREVATMAAARDSFQEETFFEYHLYTLDRPTTLKQNQTKQISLLQASGVPVEKKLLLLGQDYFYRNQAGTLTQSEKARVHLELVNDDASGLGMPLPKGIVRVYKKDGSGSEQFAGEDQIDHTPKDERVTLYVGDAFDVVADRTQTEWRAVSPRENEAAFRIEIRNRKEEEDVVVIVREPLGGEWDLLESSIEGRKRDAGTLEFEVPIAAGAETVLTYRVRTRW
jgi:hypothetical protein